MALRRAPASRLGRAVRLAAITGLACATVGTVGSAMGDDIVAPADGASSTPVSLVESLPPGSTAARCASCHVGPDGRFDIVGLAALESLPEEWSVLSEDAFDLDGDGIAGRLRYVSGGGAPLIAIYGRRLAAARLEDFARIAGAAHDIDISDAGVMRDLLATLKALSPDPVLPSPKALARFEARGCGGCHVTRTYSHGAREYAPLSDFLLHDLGDGEMRTTPLWGCPECLEAPGHEGAAPPR